MTSISLNGQTNKGLATGFEPLKETATPRPTESILRGAKNNVATEVKPVEPWTFVAKIPESATASKEAYKAWRANPATEHLVFTGYEALSPGIRVNSKTNPARRLHALVVDYDSKISDDSFKTVLDRLPADLRPTWISRSPSGFGARLVYMFEAPVPIDCEPLLQKFLDIAKDALQLTAPFARFDEPAWKNVSTLYDVGFEWKKLGDYALPTSVINYWFSQAAKKTSWNKVGEIHIPLDVIADEIVARGWDWPGVFEENARGPVFWDGGQNPSSCIVTPPGMICFSREKRFYPWAEIFGGSFVRKFQQDKIGGAIDGTWFDGKNYYRKLNDRWVTVAKEDFVKYLKVRKGLSDEKRGNLSSEVHQAEVDVQELRRIHGAVPVLFDPRDMIERDGERFLNISYVKPVKVADEVGEWGEKFPWIAKFLDTFFDPPEQLPYFLAWEKRFYGGAVHGSCPRGHTVFVVGPPSSGKTLLGLRIIGALVGGSADACDYVIKQSEFNKNVAEKALWRIDDGQVAADPKLHKKFCEMVKKVAANPTVNYRKMYSDALNNEWSGRLYITLNDDNYSLQMIPDLDMSIEDKIMIFKSAPRDPNYFLPSHVLEPMIEAELPHYARWLLEWEPPAHVNGSNPFGVRSYIHDGVRTAAMHSGQIGDLIDLVELWIKRSRPIETFGEIWMGSAAEWWAEAAKDDVLKPLIQKLTVKALGRKFVDAARIPGSRIKVLEQNNHGHRYSIDLNGSDACPIKRKSFDPTVDKC